MSKLRLGLEVSKLGPYFDSIAVPIANYFYGQQYDLITVNLDDVDMTHDISEKPPEMEAEMIRFVVISDTHWKHHVMTIPEGDVLVHCGDIFLKGGSESQFNTFLDYFSKLPHRTKIFVGGNHDHALEVLGKDRIKELCEPFDIIYLENDFLEVEGFRIFGTPFSFQSRSDNSAFQQPRADSVYEAASSDGDIDILISHQKLPQIPCQMNFFGHVHARRGVQKRNGRIYVNAAICDGRFRPLNTPILVDVPRRQ